MTTKQLQSELKKWQNAVEQSQATITWLEERNDKKTARIRALEARVRDLGGTP